MHDSCYSCTVIQSSYTVLSTQCTVPVSVAVAKVAYVLMITVYCLEGSVRTVQHSRQYTVIMSAYATVAEGGSVLVKVAYVLRITHIQSSYSSKVPREEVQLQ